MNSTLSTNGFSKKKAGIYFTVFCERLVITFSALCQMPVTFPQLSLIMESDLPTHNKILSAPAAVHRQRLFTTKRMVSLETISALQLRLSGVYLQKYWRFLHHKHMLATCFKSCTQSRRVCSSMSAFDSYNFSRKISYFWANVKHVIETGRCAVTFSCYYLWSSLAEISFLLRIMFVKLAVDNKL